MDTEQKEAFLRNKIDWTDFGTVKRYVQSPETEIDGAFVIDSSTSLAHVAAVAWSGDATRMTELMRKGAVELASQDIPDHRRCRVIYLPPAYLVQFPDDR